MFIDHIFVCTESLILAQLTLKKFGLSQGSGRVYPGQGTENIRYFFDDFYLEILSSHNHKELLSQSVRPTCLAERISWQSTGACPFGICLKKQNIPLEITDWETWKYEAPFLAGGEYINVVGHPGTMYDPFIFVLPSKMPMLNSPPIMQEPRTHSTGRHCLESVDILVPNIDQISDVILSITKVLPISISSGDHYKILMELSNENNIAKKDFTPTLPMEITWKV